MISVAYIDEETISLIRRKHPIKDILERYVSLTKKGDDYWGLCPFQRESGEKAAAVDRDGHQKGKAHAANNIRHRVLLDKDGGKTDQHRQHRYAPADPGMADAKAGAVPYRK